MEKTLIGNRIKDCIGTNSINSFAKKCDMAESLIRNYINGSIPSLEKATRIADTAGVNLQWLATGEGEKEKKSTPQPSTAFDIELYNLIILKTEIIIAKNLITITPQKRLEIYQSVYDFLKETSVNHEEIVSDNLNKIIHLMVA